MSEDVAPSPVVRPAPDPERDARVAARRAADARRAGRALDALCADYRQPLTEFERRCGVLPHPSRDWAGEPYPEDYAE